MPFGKIHQNNPQVVELATIIGLAPAAVGMKLCNFTRFDPELRNRNVAGLSNGSNIDEIVWNEFFHNGENLLAEAVNVMAH
jgi:putative restriction endonuclease